MAGRLEKIGDHDRIGSGSDRTTRSIADRKIADHGRSFNIFSIIVNELEQIQCLIIFENI